MSRSLLHIDELKKVRNGRELAILLGVDYKRLTFYARRNNASNYAEWYIPKKSGGVRTIVAPVSPLKIIQKKLDSHLRTLYKPRKHAHGFIEGEDIKENAKFHIAKRWVLNIDLLDFFPSINFGRIFRVLQSYPFNFPREVATLVAQLTTHKACLPQGAPTSPVLSNIICYKLDNLLARLAKSKGASYSRYADDITFSGNHAIVPEDMYVDTHDGSAKLGLSLRHAIESNGFCINEKKVRFAKHNTRKEVTGIIVNRFYNLHRKYIRDLRSMLNAWEKYGEDKAEAEHRRIYSNRKFRHPELPQPRFRNIVFGKINYYGFIRGKENDCYRRILSRYCILTGIEYPRKQSRVAAALEKCTWIVESYEAESQGTTFHLANIGLVTCLHCVLDSNNNIVNDITVFSAKSPEIKHSVRVERLDRALDLAILSLPEELSDSLQPGKSSHLQQDDSVVVGGYPNYQNGDSIFVREAKIASERYASSVRNLLLATPLVSGMSGGPAIDHNQKVVGIIARGGGSFREGANTEDNRIVPIEALDELIPL